MARFPRYTQKTFGTTAGSNQMAEFGSLSAGSPARFSGSTITPALVQALAPYTAGWFSAVIGQNSPAIEDMNALCYLFGYQLAYLMQSGLPEWDSGTTYYTNNIVNLSGVIYTSRTDNNLNNNPSSSPSNWALTIRQSFIKPTVQMFLTGSGTYTAPSNPAPLYIRVKMVGAGGGGAGSGTAVAGAGSNGTNTTFNDATAGGGMGGPVASPGGGGSGGSATLGTAMGVGLSGGPGGGIQFSSGGGSEFSSMPGGSSALGGASMGTGGFTGGLTAAANTGSGGSGGSVDGTPSNFTGSGGGAGAYIDAIYTTVPVTCSYSVGTGGALGTAGTNGVGGGAGADGGIWIEEYYQ